MRVFGGTGEPREPVKCVGQRARSTCYRSYAVEGKEPKSTFFLFQTRTTLNVREDKGGSPERTDRRDLTYPNRTIAA
ncbi:hypothetical protein HanRHA438_Chr05g0225321 [Helianthus annuus]|uniref:Uncharacterized protein n=1 Tax=Helianthus annuus TaxID=4232 RepID=A0A9K3DF75_HELAN|nr:hypothetical protein HanXRQr2_MTg0835511 [Helianthus annuus]KAJ0919072.1 hypothetical protein HanRHA438_Chr05g0225321 [Helianthus annuus]KAJ0922849.1 hypothetical protein HanPSC8_Chr05g0208601 [Helianthus annuus]